MINKSVYRKAIIKDRNLLSVEVVNTNSRIICDRFLNSVDYKKASVILSYCSYNNEVDTKYIFEKAIYDGKRVAYPKSIIIDNVPTLEFYYIDSLHQLTIGYKGIMEPDTVHYELKRYTEGADICIVPCVGFDISCNRIGYGKGFYDRFLSGAAIGKSIIFAYEMQKCIDFNNDSTDYRADMIITEENIYYK